MEDFRLTITVPEVAKILGLGRNSAYEAVAKGEIPVIKIGKRLLVPRAALEKMLNEARSLTLKRGDEYDK